MFDLPKLVNYLFLTSVFLLSSCSTETEDSKKNSNNSNYSQENNLTETNNDKSNNSNSNKFNYSLLQKKVIYGNAKLSEVKQALTDTDVGSLTNTIHGLYSMRWHRGVYNLLDELWTGNKEKNPDFSWDLLEKAPVKIALASTINRIKIINTDEQLKYIRSHKNDEHEFHRAQVVVALGMNGKPDDIEYIKSMAMAENHYVAQSAISGLALMGGEQAKYALGEIWKEFQGTPRGDLAEKVILKAYNVVPNLISKDSDQ